MGGVLPGSVAVMYHMKITAQNIDLECFPESDPHRCQVRGLHS